jgi:putative acetyltransferase
MAIEIRAEVPADYGRVFEVESAAFERRNEAELVEALRSSAHPYVSLVAVSDGQIVGHIFFSPVTFESYPEAPPAGSLGPVAVDLAHQGQGIGGALVRAGLEQCPRHGWSSVFLVGDPAYYSRFGFALAAARGLTYGNPFFDAVLQVFDLNPGALDGCEGRVCFHPAFAAAETG